MRCLAAWVFLIICQAHASACTLRFPTSLQSLTGRVAAVHLTVKHGAVASLRSVPFGWDMYIDNDPSWNTKVSGHALVGAAFLRLQELPELISVIPEPHYSCSQLSELGLLRLTIKLYENDHMRDIVISHLSANE